MFSARYKIFGSEKVKHPGLSFQKIWKDVIIFNTCCVMKKIANEWEMICCLFHNFFNLCERFICLQIKLGAFLVLSNIVES